MIKIENTYTGNWEAALRGMRNPKNSWEKSDSWFSESGVDYRHDINRNLEHVTGSVYGKNLDIGPNDLKLAQALVAGGPVHAKFRRMITVSCDITAPLYWWKDFDTYRIGRSDETEGAYNPHDIEYNSCSTMHKIHAKEFTLEDFSTEHLNKASIDNLECTILSLNNLRQWYCKYDNLHEDVKTKLEEIDNIKCKKDLWWNMIQLLPSSYNQKRTVTMNYEVLAGLYPMRKDHKLDEFRDFCKWIETLPYAKELIIGEEIYNDDVNNLKVRLRLLTGHVHYLQEMLIKELYAKGTMSIYQIANKVRLHDSDVRKIVVEKIKKETVKDLPTSPLLDPKYKGGE